MGSKLKYLQYFIIISALVISISMQIFEYYKKNELLSFKSGEIIHRFRKIKANQKKINEQIQLESIRKQLTNIELDTNYLYSLNQEKYTKLNQTPVCYNFSYDELNRLKTNGVGSNGINQWTQILQSKNPQLTKNIFQIDNLSRQKKQKINITGIGDISFCLEDSMKIDETYRALLIISKGIEHEYLNLLMQKAYEGNIPKIMVDTMPLSKKIFASILPTSADQFTIIRGDLDTVKTIDLEGKDYITWEWFITPKKAGVNNLILKLSRAETQISDLDKFFPSKIIKVNVFAEEKTFFEKLDDFWRGEWKWILTSIAAIFSWILLYKQNKEKKALEASKNSLPVKENPKPRKKK